MEANPKDRDTLYVQAAPITNPKFCRRLLLAYPMGKQQSVAVQLFSRMLVDDIHDMVDMGIIDGHKIVNVPIGGDEGVSTSRR